MTTFSLHAVMRQAQCSIMAAATARPSHHVMDWQAQKRHFLLGEQGAIINSIVNVMKFQRDHNITVSWLKDTVPPVCDSVAPMPATAGPAVFCQFWTVAALTDTVSIRLSSTGNYSPSKARFRCGRGPTGSRHRLGAWREMDHRAMMASPIVWRNHSIGVQHGLLDPAEYPPRPVKTPLRRTLGFPAIHWPDW